mgnify:CR=1 FL=1
MKSAVNTARRNVIIEFGQEIASSAFYHFFIILCISTDSSELSLELFDNSKIGYMPTRVWGTPTTAMWVYRLGPEKAKRMLFTGDKISGLEAEKLGLILKACSKETLDDDVDSFAMRMTTVPLNQLAMQKILINQAVESSGLLNSQKFATIFDGISRHSLEGLNFKKMSEEDGWKRAVKERDNGTYDWTKDRPSN